MIKEAPTAEEAAVLEKFGFKIGTAYVEVIGETEREVFVALMEACACACAWRYNTGELCLPVRDASRASWLARFDAASKRGV